MIKVEAKDVVEVVKGEEAVLTNMEVKMKVEDITAVTTQIITSLIEIQTCTLNIPGKMNQGYGL